VEFYRKVFDWKISKWEGPMGYWLAATGKKEEPGIDGAIMEKGSVKSTVNTIDVPSLDEYARRVKQAGGKQLTDKMEIPGVGDFCYCEDTEGNVFGIIQSAPGSM